MSTSRPRAALRFVEIASECAIYLGAWWLFTGSASMAELFVGSVALVLSFVGSHLVGFRLGAQFRVKLEAILQVWRVPLLVLSGSIDLMKVLAKDLSGREKAGSRLRAVRFVHSRCSMRARVR